MTPSPESRPEETDMELITRWKAGDSRAATRLVGRHSQALARFAASAGEREGIEELVQDDQELKDALNELEFEEFLESLRS